MAGTVDRAIAIVGVGAIMPDAADADAFWQNLADGRYSISDVPPERWDPDLYYDPDPAAPDKTYSRIGGWVGAWDWNPLAWRLPIPPRVSDVMDLAQKWAIVTARHALLDYGWPERALNPERTAVILGNALGGDTHLLSAARILFPEVGDELAHAPTFQSLPAEVRGAVMEELLAGVRSRIPDITEDTMPGELSNIVAGRVAAVFDFRGPNFVTDAACASAMAAVSAAVEGLEEGDYDTVLTGGIDANMSPSTFVKFCKIGALSGTGTRPYADGADGFVMGEGAATFLLKRLEDAERDGDRVYAVIRGLGGSSDGRGKGITAPNPVGQRLAVARAWERAGLRPEAGDMVEGHGTSTRVGDVVEVESLGHVFRDWGLASGSVALGSVKSNIGHLKAGAGAAGLFKAALALHHKQLPPSLNFERPNPAIDFAASPFRVVTELAPWDKPGGDAVRRAGVSAFGFGGTNFHAVLEEYVPGRLGRRAPTSTGAELERPGVPGNGHATRTGGTPPASGGQPPRMPLRGALLVGAATDAELAWRLRQVAAEAAAGQAPDPRAPLVRDLEAPVRVAIDYGDAEELAAGAEQAATALEEGDAGRWRALRNKGVFLGRGRPGKVAFLFTGQGSQYVGMLRELRRLDPVVAATFDEADGIMTPLIGGPLSDRIFVDEDDEAAMAAAEEDLKQTAITQPAVLTVDTALARLMGSFGICPDMVMGHSLGEYAALVAAGAMTFRDSLMAVSARGRAMTDLTLGDNGTMAAVFGAVDRVAELVEAMDGYVVVANLNSTKECVIGGATEDMDKAMEALRDEGLRVVQLPVSHAFHTRIVAPASEPLSITLRGLDLRPPEIPIVANVDGEFYRMEPGSEAGIVDVLATQIGAPVQFVKGLRTLYEAGARIFVEMGPKRVLYGLAEDVLGEHDDVTSLYTNHPRTGDVVAANRALCGLWAAGVGEGAREEVAAPTPDPVVPTAPAAGPEDRYLTLGRMFADFLDRSFQVYGGEGRRPQATRVGITGASLGLPGTEGVLADDNAARLLEGTQLIEAVPAAVRTGMLGRRITRLVKGSGGEASFETIADESDVVKLAGQGRDEALVERYGFPRDRVAALDRVTRLAIAAGIDALRDAGIPLVRRYRTTTTGSQLPEGWELPEEMRDDTGIIFGSAFPGVDTLVRTMDAYHEDRTRRARLDELRTLRDAGADHMDSEARLTLERRLAEAEAAVEEEPFQFDRRFLLQVLAMGHSQFAEYIGARGPNIQTNAACATGTQAVALAGDWIEAGRCRRVIVVTADDVTNEAMFPWFGAGFLASGAAATDARVEDAALPFDRRRHGMIVGMGAAALVVEDLSSAAGRGLDPICELLGTEVANSAFHGTRLDVEHIAEVMERLVAGVEARHGLRRDELARELVFVSHETYTPARGGSASAEVRALRHVFGARADDVVVANTKGFTGHPMAVAIEDVLAVRMLETGIVPPVANFREVDPELGRLNLSRGGSYPVRYALRLGAGFGSQISMSLLRWTPPPDGARRDPRRNGFAGRVRDPSAWNAWLRRVTGYEVPELEVEARTLRLRDQGPPRPTRVPPRSMPASAEAPVRTATAPIPPTTPKVVEAPPEVAAPPSPAVTETTPATAPAPSSSEVESEVRGRVLGIVAEQTGYPADMLEMDLDLEADLGIDTVKQAEMFAAIRDAYDIERDENLALRDYPTLAHAIEFVFEKRPELRGAGGGGVPVAAPAEPVATAAAPPATPTVESEVRERVLGIVAEQTGYPADMLELDLDLEADLGIDTVKQAEMFAAIREAYDIERDENLALRDYPTLAHAIEFVFEKRPELRSKVGAAAATDAPAEVGSDATATGTVEAPAPRSSVHRGSMEAARALPRRGPVARLRPPATRFDSTGVELAEGDRVVLMSDEGGVGAALKGRLEARGVTVLDIDGDPSVADMESMAEAWAAAGPVRGVYWLPALDGVDQASLEDAGSRRAALHRRVKLLHATMRALYEWVGASGTFLVAGTRLGGRHGYDEDGATDVAGGAVTGFTKSFGRERPEALVKAVDFEPSRKTAALADLLLEETLHDPGVVEVGYARDRRWAVAFEDLPPHEPEGVESTWKGGGVHVVTGAAGSIVSAIVADLASAGGGTFWLLDLTPEPDPADPDLQRFRTDPDGLKRELFERMRARGERATPARVERALAGIERSATALATMEAVRAAGGRAVWRSCDLRDAEAVAEILAELRGQHDAVDVLIHAAGLEISRSLPDKSPEEFALVFDVKADGWLNLMAGLADTPLGAAVVFSSIAGRFGNAGQADYSAANDLLCKAVSALRRTRPDTRGLALDWTAWADIGMAARGSIPAVMARAGIDMLPPEAGIPVVRRELGLATRAELVVAQALGTMLEDRAPRGGWPAESGSSAGPMAGMVTRFSPETGLEMEVTLDPADQPFLGDHRIDGVAVLPGVMGLEAMAEAALTGFPELRLVAVEDVRFLAPFKFYRDERRTVYTTARFALEGDQVVADCEVLGRRTLHGRAEPEVTVHFRGRIRLAAQDAAAASSEDRPVEEAEGVEASDIYRLFFHGPAYQVVARAWRTDGRVEGRLAAPLPANHAPAELPTVAAPRLVELAFQVAGLAEMSASRRMGLPDGIGRLEFSGGVPGEAEGMVAVAQASDGEEHEVVVIDGDGRVRLELTGYRTSALPGVVDATPLERLNG